MARRRADVVVVAAGSSQRFGSDKLAADVGDRPLLAWTIDRLAASRLVERIVVVTAAQRVDRIRTAAWLSPKVAAVVAGGSRRQDSVARGIAAVAAFDGAKADDEDDRVVLVHDGARPLVSLELIAAVIDGVVRHGAAVPMLPILETVKRVGSDGRIRETIDRAGLAAAQTPQGATLGRFSAALRTVREGRDEGAPEYTDEAALLEACTIAVHAIPGDPANIKVTLPGDLARVETILTGRPADWPAIPTGVRVGYGADSHPFGPGDGLVLGGLRLAHAPRLHGHSDGDVLLHAVAGALLGAAGLGDLGRMFPAGPATQAGIDSAELLGEVQRRVADAGHAVTGVDCTIVAARPRLASRLPAMGERIAELLGVDPSTVNVKASTGNLDGMEGAGRGISASAVVVLTAGGAR